MNQASEHRKNVKRGRPPGALNKTPLSDWVPFSTTLSPVAKDWLRMKKAGGAQTNIMLNNIILEMKAGEEDTNENENES